MAWSADIQQREAAADLLSHPFHHTRCIGHHVLDVTRHRQVVHGYRHGQFLVFHGQRDRRFFHRAERVQGLIDAEEARQAGHMRIVQLDDTLRRRQRVMSEDKARLFERQYPRQRLEIRAAQHRAGHAIDLHITARFLCTCRSAA